jgi:hypothetical protein
MELCIIQQNVLVVAVTFSCVLHQLMSLRETHTI